MVNQKIELVVLGVIRRDDKYLLTYRGDSQDKPKSKYIGWQLPGGKLEFGESLEKCLTREIKEEVGLDIEVVVVIPKIVTDVRSTKSGRWQGIFIPYLCRMKNKEAAVILNNEASKYGWFKLEDVANLKTLPLDYQIAVEAHKIK